MIHGNTKYNFEPLRQVNGEVIATTSNIYALKSSIRAFLKLPIKGILEFTEIETNVFKVKRIKDNPELRTLKEEK